MPKRIQRKRTKGWRMPEGAVYVGRPTRWGNPYKVGETWHTLDGSHSRTIATAGQAVELYRHWLAISPIQFEIVPELAGHDLACWCPLGGEPCHADVLLELANKP